MKLHSRFQIFGLAAVLAAFVGCAVGPNYKRPAVNTPEQFRFTENQETNSFGDLPWWKVFQDPILQGLIGTAITNNYDLKQAVARVELARNQAAAANSAFFPQIGYSGDIGRGRNALYNSPAGLKGGTTRSAQLTLGVVWEIDFWGRIRRSSEAARAQFLATDAARRGVTISLVSQVAVTYFQLLDLDQEMAIQCAATNAYASSYQIFNDRLSNGVASKLETDRAAAALANAAAVIPQLEIQIASAENQLSVLLGQNPGPILRSSLTNQPQLTTAIPAGLPSDLLRRRPDVVAAEESLIAANANIGVSIANFFPQIGLTTLLGRASPELSQFTGSAGNLWDLGGTLSGPIFQGGKLRAQYRGAKAQFNEAKAAYQQTVLTSFQEVANALITRQKLAEEFTYQGQAVVALESSVFLATQRYLNGKSSYYEVLQSQQELYPTQRAQVQTQVEEMITIVQLYKALGGGWETSRK